MRSGEAVVQNADSTGWAFENESLRSLVAEGEKMKKRVFSIALSGSVLTLLLAASAYAQMPGAPLRATIPFDFNIRGKTLPAGDYEIRRITDEPGGLEVLNVHRSNEHAMFETGPVEAARIARHSEIIFHRYGDTYFLHEVWSAGLETGRELPLSRQERFLRSETASNGRQSEPETVSVAVY
jgi:hypothetical protein